MTAKDVLNLVKEKNMLPRARKDKLTVRSVENEFVVYDEKTGSTHHLNEVVTLVWQYCNGRHSVSDMASAISEKLAIPEDEGIVMLSLKQLSKAGLLDERTDEIVKANSKGLSRRKLLRQVAVAALALPLISTIEIKTALANYVSTGGCASLVPGMGGQCTGWCPSGTYCKKTGSTICSCYSPTFP